MCNYLRPKFAVSSRITIKKLFATALNLLTPSPFIQTHLMEHRDINGVSGPEENIPRKVCFLYLLYMKV